MLSRTYYYYYYFYVQTMGKRYVASLIPLDYAFRCFYPPAFAPDCRAVLAGGSPRWLGAARVYVDML